MTTNLTWHLLPTSDTTNLFIYEGDGRMYCDKEARLRTGGTKGDQHIYLCSTGPIKEGNWAFNIRTKKAYKANSDLKEYLNPDLRKIILTTDPKLIADGVPAIDGNTKAEYYPNGHTETILVNFLEEFCKRYNQKDKGVDVLYRRVRVKCEDCVRYMRRCLTCGGSGVEIKYEPIQSTGQYSLILDWIEDQKKVDADEDRYASIKQYIQSLQPSSKGEIVIECEMEPLYSSFQASSETGIEGKYGDIIAYQPKLTNGQPTLIFK